MRGTLRLKLNEERGGPCLRTVLKVFCRKLKKKAQKQKKWEQKQKEKKRKLAEFMASNADDSDDDQEILKEARLLKKLRKGKITEEYDSPILSSLSFTLKSLQHSSFVS